MAAHARRGPLGAFSYVDAEVFGLLEAIVINHVEYLTNDSRQIRKKDSFVDGKYWLSRSIAQWESTFSFVSRKTIQRAIIHLEQLGILISRPGDTISSPKLYRVDADVISDLIEAHFANETPPDAGGGGQIDQGGVVNLTILKYGQFDHTYNKELNINEWPVQERAIQQEFPHDHSSSQEESIMSATTDATALVAPKNEREGVVVADYAANRQNPPRQIELARKQSDFRCPECKQLVRVNLRRPECPPDQNGCGQRFVFIVDGRKQKVVEHVPPTTPAAMYLAEITRSLHYSKRWSEFDTVEERDEWMRHESELGTPDMKARVEWAARKGIAKNQIVRAIFVTIEKKMIFTKPDASDGPVHVDNRPIRESVRVAPKVNPLRQQELELQELLRRPATGGDDL